MDFLLSGLAILDQWNRPSPKEPCLPSQRKAVHHFQPPDPTKDFLIGITQNLLSLPLLPLGLGLNELPLGPALCSRLFLDIQQHLRYLETENLSSLASMRPRDPRTCSPEVTSSTFPTPSGCCSLWGLRPVPKWFSGVLQHSPASTCSESPSSGGTQVTPTLYVTMPNAQHHEI